MQQHKAQSGQLKLLRIVFVTDIHLSTQNLQKLQQWNNLKKPPFDFCLCAGDVSNCDQNAKTHNQAQMEYKTNQVMIRLKQIFKCKILYIPGNHDPLSYFNNKMQIQSGIISIHDKCIQLAEKLYLVGYGGSVPGYLDQQCSEQVWKGYPFQSNQQLKDQLSKRNIFQKALQKQSQVIVMTHTGPFKSSTTIVNSLKKIYSGAHGFDYLVQKQNLLLYLHGHTHDGSKYQRINQKPIINPGPLLYGQFCNIVLQLRDKRWQIMQTNFIQL